MSMLPLDRCQNCGMPTWVCCCENPQFDFIDEDKFIHESRTGGGVRSEQEIKESSFANATWQQLKVEGRDHLGLRIFADEKRYVAYSEFERLMQSSDYNKNAVVEISQKMSEFKARLDEVIVERDKLLQEVAHSNQGYQYLYDEFGFQGIRDVVTGRMYVPEELYRGLLEKWETSDRLNMVTIKKQKEEIELLRDKYQNLYCMITKKKR